jgi:hypothetical protein
LQTEEKAKSEEVEINRITVKNIAKEVEDERLSRTEKLRKKEENEALVEDARKKLG